jgi:hypothetical protein
MQITEETAGSGSILADRLGKLDAATQGWKKRVGPTDAVQFSVAGRMMMEHTGSSAQTCAGDVTLTPTVPSSPPPQLLGHSSADRKRRTPRAERFRSKAGESTSCFCCASTSSCCWMTVGWQPHARNFQKIPRFTSLIRSYKTACKAKTRKTKINFPSLPDGNNDRFTRGRSSCL